MCLSADWRCLEEHFNSLCNNLPDNYQLTIDKLKTIPQLFKDGEQLSKMIATSSSSAVRKINEKILTYLIVKLCCNGSSTSLVRSCDEMDESFINSTDTPTCVEQIRCGMYNHLNYVYGFANECLVCTYSTHKVSRMHRVSFLQ